MNNPVSVNDPTGAYAESLYPEQRALGRGPTFRGWNDNSFGGPPGSGSHWADHFAFYGMSPGTFINTALNSTHGGSWSNGVGYLFTSSEQAFAAGVSYNIDHNAWDNTHYGSYEASLVGYVALRVTGILLSQRAVHSAINIIQNGMLTFGSAITCNEPNCTHGMMGPRVEYSRKSSGLSTSFIAETTFTLTVAAGKSTLSVMNKEFAKQNLINNMLKKSDLNRIPFKPVEAPGSVKLVGKYGGWVFGGWSAYDIYKQRETGQISNTQFLVEQASNGVSTFGGLYGFAWGLGWTLGKEYGPSKWYGSDDSKWFK